MIIKSLKSHKFWNMRRFAAYAIGGIGSNDPALIKDAILILEKYLGDPSWWLLKLMALAQKDEDVATDLAVALGMGVDPEVWLRDAASMHWER